MLTLIVAASENNVIGKDNDLLWHLPNDFKRFKKLTTGHHIIMGRKTLDSLPGLLPKREHIVVTRNKNFEHKGCEVFQSLEEAILFSKSNDDNPFIIGGGEIYKQSILLADRIEITRVHVNIEGDTFFPVIDHEVWKLVKEEFHPSDDKHKYAFTFLTYEKKEQNNA